MSTGFRCKDAGVVRNSAITSDSHEEFVKTVAGVTALDRLV